MAYGHSNNNNYHHRFNQNPNNNRGGGRDHHRPRFSSRPPQDQSSGDRDGLRHMDDGGTGHAIPPSARNRTLPFSGPRDNTDNDSYVKLYVASIPWRATEDDVRLLFEEHGKVLEVILVKDTRTGQRREFGFINYASFEEAERAIKALDNQYTFPGGACPIKVRFADRERSRLHNFSDVAEVKLYVAELNKQATEQDIEEIFSPYGRIEDIFILRDEKNQSKGLGFVEFSRRDMAVAAINALNGTYVMTGCNQPLTVRFAIPKKPKIGEHRSEPAFRGFGFGPRPHSSQGFRSESNYGGPTGAHIQPNSWQKRSPQSFSLSPPQAHDHSSRSVAKTDVVTLPTNLIRKPSKIEVPPGGQLLPLEKPLHPSLQLPPTLQVQTLEARVPPEMHTTLPTEHGHPQIPDSLGHGSEELPPEHLSESATQPHTQQRTSVAPQTEILPSTARQHKLCPPAIDKELQQPLQESPNQLARVLAQETGSCQSREQTRSQAHLQLHLMQQSSQNPTDEQKSEDAKLQASPTGNMQQGTRIYDTPPRESAASTTSSIPSHTQGAAFSNFEWSEHTCPDGFKYYYNCITKESRWEKPDELSRFEQRQQNHSHRNVEVQPTAQNMVTPATSVY